MSYANLYVYNGLMYTDIIIQNHNIYIYIYVLYILYIRYIDNMYSMFRYRQIIHLLTMAHIWSLPPKKRHREATSTRRVIRLMPQCFTVL